MTADVQRQILSNGTLVLRSVKAEDSGYYTCTATNTLGFDTIIVNLVVQGKEKPVCLTDGRVVGSVVHSQCVSVQFLLTSLV